MSKGNFIAQLSKKERRTLNHIINTCFKYEIGFQFFGHGCFDVQHFVDGDFKFRVNIYSFDLKNKPKVMSELREKLDAYIKCNVLNKE